MSNVIQFPKFVRFQHSSEELINARKTFGSDYYMYVGWCSQFRHVDGNLVKYVGAVSPEEYFAIN